MASAVPETPRPASTAHKLGLLASLYFSQGLPFGFFTQALPVVLRQRAVSLEEIGLTTLLGAPWALKFLWAPLVDRYHGARLGRRRSWIVPLQLLTALVLLSLAALESRASLALAILMVAVLVLNLLAATQDIATDGLAVDLVTPAERGLANGIQVAGYRVGMIVGGGALLVFYEHVGAAWTFTTMAALIGLASLPILATREPSPREDDGSRERARGAPRRERPKYFLRRPGAWRLIALIVAYKAGDTFATGMLRPFLVDLGLGIGDVGWLLGTLGVLTGLLGAVTGGALINRLGRRRALLAFGSLQAATVAGYAWLASTTPSYSALAVATAAEHFASGMATAALFTCMMDWCERHSAATDYTIQASAVSLAIGVGSALAGFSAGAIGYFNHFCLAAGVCVASLLLVRTLFPIVDAVDAARAVAPEART